MSETTEVKGDFAEEREEILETLNNLDFLISPTALKEDYTDYTSYDKFVYGILKPMLEAGQLVKVPSSAKGDLIQTPEKVREIMETAVNGESN